MRLIVYCALLLVSAVSTVTAQCDFIPNNCVIRQGCYDSKDLAQYHSDNSIPAKNQRSCIMCYFSGSEPVKLDMFFSHGTRNSDPSNSNCPSITGGDSHVAIAYLEACAEKVQDANTNGLSIDQKLSMVIDGTWEPTATCTPVNHTVTSPLFSTKEVLDFSSGIRVASSYVPLKELMQGCGIHEPNRTKAGKNAKYATIERMESGTGDCNVVKTGMRDIVFDHINMDNEKCVIASTSGNSKLAKGECPLETVSPDSMELMRVSPMFSFVDPEEIELRYVKFTTGRKYRQACPGRALMSADQRNAKAYPPTPVNIDKMCFDYVEDTHEVPNSPTASKPDLVDPEETDAAFRCPPEIPESVGNMCLEKIPQNSDGGKYLDTTDQRVLAWPDNPSTNISGRSVNMTVLCPDGKKTNPLKINTETPTCVPDEDIMNRTAPRKECPIGHSRMPIGLDIESSNDTEISFMCVPTKYNSIASRPIDVVLWDFAGSVFFSNNWPDEQGDTFTVLVFGDKDISSSSKMKEGEVFEDYFDETSGTMLGVFLPDKRIT